MKIVKKCRKEKENLRLKVEAYNAIATDSNLKTASVEELCKGNIPWKTEGFASG